jgi:hypothetical protein
MYNRQYNLSNFISRRILLMMEISVVFFVSPPPTPNNHPISQLKREYFMTILLLDVPFTEALPR